MSYKDVIRKLEWEEAMKEELNASRKNEISPTTTLKKIVSCESVLKMKYDVDEEISRHNV